MREFVVGSCIAGGFLLWVGWLVEAKVATIPTPEPVILPKPVQGICAEEIWQAGKSIEVRHVKTTQAQCFSRTDGSVYIRRMRFKVTGND